MLTITIACAKRASNWVTLPWRQARGSNTARRNLAGLHRRSDLGAGKPSKREGSADTASDHDEFVLP